MKTTTKAAGAALLALGMAATAFAQPAPRRGAGVARIMDALQLTDAQRQKVQPILDQQREQMRDVREKMRGDREALRAAAQASNADPAAVGRAFLALKADREAAKAHREAFRSQLAKVLTPEQNARLDAFFAGMRAGRGMRGGPGAGMGMRGGPAR